MAVEEPAHFLKYVPGDERKDKGVEKAGVDEDVFGRSIRPEPQDNGIEQDAQQAAQGDEDIETVEPEH